MSQNNLIQTDRSFLSDSERTAIEHEMHHYEDSRAASIEALKIVQKHRGWVPDGAIPAIGETVPGFESTAWFGVFGPAKLPPAITEKLNAVIVGALADPNLRARLQTEGATPVGDTPAAFAAFVREDIARWAPIVKASGATVN